MAVFTATIFAYHAPLLEVNSLSQASPIWLGFPFAIYLLMVALGAAASIIDVRHHRIPNTITLAGAAAGIAVSGFCFWPEGLWLGLLGFVTGFALLLPGYLLGMTGGGDVKLMAAFGTFLGPGLTLRAFIIYIIAGMTFALIYSLYARITQGAPLPFTRYWLMLRTLAYTGRVAYLKPAPTEAMGRRMPMAPAIAIGALAAPLIASPPSRLPLPF